MTEPVSATRQAVLDFLAAATSLDLSTYDDDALIQRDLGISSLEAERISVMVELRFRVELDEAERMGVRTLGQFVDLVADAVEFQG